MQTGPGLDDAITLAEDLVASGLGGSATPDVASLSRGAVRSDAEPSVRAMLTEFGHRSPIDRRRGGAVPPTAVGIRALGPSARVVRRTVLRTAYGLGEPRRTRSQARSASARTQDRLTERCGLGTPYLWLTLLNAVGTEPGAAGRWWPAARRPAQKPGRPGAPSRGACPGGAAGRRHRDRAGRRPPAPRRDQLLIAGRGSARRMLDATLSSEPSAAYVVDRRVVASSWVWRQLSREGSRGRHGDH